MRSYGELFRQGDTIGVHIDMDIGTLSFSRNGKDLGTAMAVVGGGGWSWVVVVVVTDLL